MQNFVYQNGTKIIFEKSTETQVGFELKVYTKKVLLHYGGGSIERTGLYERILSSLKEANIEVIELDALAIYQLVL